MTDTMIERVAIALENELRRQHEGEYLVRYFPRGPGSDWLTVDGNIYVTPLVRAILAAMREPTEAMLDAAEDKECQSPRGTARAMHHAMIDAALTDQP
jgi:hypothetical protein